MISSICHFCLLSVNNIDLSSNISIMSNYGFYIVYSDNEFIFFRRNIFDFDEDIILYVYGCIVLWGCTDYINIANVLGFNYVMYHESLEYYIYDGNFKFDAGKIYFSRNYDITLQKVAVSYPLSYSSKIWFFEDKMSIISNTALLFAEKVRNYDLYSILIKDIFIEIGQLFIYRYSMYLVVNIIKAPTFIWNQDNTIEKTYIISNREFDINGRVDILESKFDAIKDFLLVLVDEKNYSKTELYEKLITIFIAFEIIIGIVSIILHLYKFM